MDSLHYRDTYQRWSANADYVIAVAPIAQCDQLFAFPYTRWLPPSHPSILVLRKREPD